MSLPALTVQQNGVSQVSADQLNTYVQSCTNMANLRAFVGITGVRVFVGGFSVDSDGGQGTFYWNASGTGPDDNGLNNVVPNGSTVGCWTREGATGTGTIINSLFSPNGTITISSPTGAVTEDINLANTNIWIGTQTIPLGTNSTAVTQSVGDNSTKIATDAFVQTALTSGGPVAGSAVNLLGTVNSSTTFTISADEVIVETALGGTTYKLSSFSKLLTITNVGVNGMDTGSPPTNGAIYVYAIYNPTTLTQGILGTTSGAGATIYAGAHMPAGYTASALISTVMANGSAQLFSFIQFGRSFVIGAQVASSSLSSTSFVTLSLAPYVPPNAKSASGYATQGATGGTISVASDTANTGLVVIATNAGSASATGFWQCYLATAQNIFYKVASGSSGTVVVSGYTI